MNYRYLKSLSEMDGVSLHQKNISRVAKEAIRARDEADELHERNRVLRGALTDLLKEFDARGETSVSALNAHRILNEVE